MQYKDLLRIKEDAAKFLTAMPAPLYPEGKIEPLNDNERLTLAIYDSTIMYLCRKFKLKWDPDLELESVEPDSNPMEEDYT